MSEADFRDEWIATSRGRLFARVWPGAGDAAPIILFHDSLGSVELWRDFPAHLRVATGRDVVAYDRLGFGRSDARNDVLTKDFISEEATTGFAALREQLRIAAFVAFGHSVGGGMAVYCAGRYDAECRALITESAQAFVEARTLAGIRAAEEDFRKPGQLERLQKYHGDKAAWVLRAWTQTWQSNVFANWSIEAELACVKCPTLVLHGEHDEYGSALHPRRIANGVSGPAQLEILPGLHHVPHREAEATVLSLVKTFLADIA